MTTSSPTGVRTALAPEVRFVFWGVLGLSALIGLLLFLVPGATDIYGPWVFLHPRSAILISAAYLGAAVYYVLGLRRNDWVQAENGVGGLVVYSLVLLAAMMVHWDTFRPYHPATILYFIFYYAGIFVLPILYRLQGERTGDTAAGAARSASGWQVWLVVRGFFYLALALAGFLFAEGLSAVWPWPILPLEVRVFVGQAAVLGWGGLVALRDGRGGLVWPRHRLSLVLVGVIGAVQLVGILVGPTPYNVAPPLGVIVPVVFLEWLLTPLAMLYVYRNV